MNAKTQDKEQTNGYKLFWEVLSILEKSLALLYSINCVLNQCLFFFLGGCFLERLNERREYRRVGFGKSHFMEIEGETRQECEVLW